MALFKNFLMKMKSIHSKYPLDVEVALELILGCVIIVVVSLIQQKLGVI